MPSKQKQSVKQSVRQSVVVKIEHPKPKKKRQRRPSGATRPSQFTRVQYTPAPIPLQSNVNQEKTLLELQRLQEYVANNLKKPLGERTGDLMETPPINNTMMAGLAAAQRQEEEKQMAVDEAIAQQLQTIEKRTVIAEPEIKQAEVLTQEPKRGPGRPRKPVLATAVSDPLSTPLPPTTTPSQRGRSTGRRTLRSPPPVRQQKPLKPEPLERSIATLLKQKKEAQLMREEEKLSRGLI